MHTFATSSCSSCCACAPRPSATTLWASCDRSPPCMAARAKQPEVVPCQSCPSSDCASALPGEFKRQCPNRVRFLPTRRITRTGGVLREQYDLQRYCLSAAGLPGLLRGSVRNENCQEWWESDGRETRTSLEQRHSLYECNLADLEEDGRAYL